MRFIFLLFTCLFLTIGLYGQNGKGLSLSMSLGFGYENKPIARPSSQTIQPIFRVNIITREIIYIRALSIGVGKSLNKHIIVGGELSYYWAVLDYVGDYQTFPRTGIKPSINNISWISIGSWGKYIFFPESRFHLGIMGSFGIHAGYPKNMGVNTIERQVTGYIGIHAGAEYQISDKFNLSYYFGRGKYNNIISVDYTF